MKTLTYKTRRPACFLQAWGSFCCLIFMIVCPVAMSSANPIDFSLDSEDNAAASAADTNSDDSTERNKIVLIKSQENMSDDWNNATFWSTGETPYSAKDSVFIVPGGMRVRSRNNMSIQTFGKENANNSLYFGYDADKILRSTFTLITPDSNNPYRQLYVAN